MLPLGPLGHGQQLQELQQQQEHLGWGCGSGEARQAWGKCALLEVLGVGSQLRRCHVTWLLGRSVWLGRGDMRWSC